MRKKIIGLSLLFVFIITSGFGCKASTAQLAAKMTPVTIEFWGTQDDSDAYVDIINSYKQLHPFITVNYTKFRPEEYEDALLNAFAEDRGPDIFSIHNTWIQKYLPKLAPLPAKITMVYPEVQGTIQKTTVPVERTTQSLTLNDLKNNFVDVVSRDVVDNSQIWGLPMSVDTLAMYYNRDLLSNAGLTDVPKYWNSNFQQSVKKLSKQDIKGNIIQSGVALGGSTNINRYSDILAALMMQNGATLLSDGGTVLFNQVPVGSNDTSYNPGAAALKFYTDFSNPIKEVYSWNSEMPNSLDAFMGGNLAFMFGYSYQLPVIRAQALKLNFGIAPLPQIEGSGNSVNFANYWVNGVAKKSKNPNICWDFIQYMSKAENVKGYLDKTKRPTALKALIPAQRQDLDIGVFADQVLTAKSWYRGQNVKVAEAAMGEMIDAVVKDDTKIMEAMNLAASRVQQTISQ
ncbi:MAG: extracellular solute-binding protein [Candidatus Falkowbacteria bacterium]